MKRRNIVEILFFMCCIGLVGCQKATSAQESENMKTLTVQAEKTVDESSESDDINWKCIYMGAEIVDTYSESDSQIKFTSEDDWTSFANVSLPNSIVDVVEQQIDWETQGVVVLQAESAKGYFDFVPSIADINITDGVLNVMYEDNTDSTKTFYVKSDDNSDVVKTIYMILLDKSDMEQIEQ